MTVNKPSTSLGILLTFFYIPAQILFALFFNYSLARSITTGMLNDWYVFFSLTSLFSLLELSYPTLAISFFNGKNGRSKGAFSFFIKKSLGVVIPLQIVFTVYYSQMINSSFLIFGVGLILRSIANIINSYLYASKKIIIDKTYKFIYAIIMPVCFIFARYILNVQMNITDLTTVWCISSLICLLYSSFFLVFSFKLSGQKNCCGNTFNLPIKNNIKLFFTVLPAIFIYTLSINYIKYFGGPSEESGTILYGVFLQVFNIYNVIVVLVASYFIPMISKAYHDGDSISPIIFKILDVSITISVSAASFIALFGIEGVTLMLKDKVSNVSYWYIAAVIMIFYIETCQVVLTSIGTGIGIYNYYKQSICSAAFVFALSYIFIPKYGVEGLMFSILFSQLVTCFIFNPIIVLKVAKLSTMRYVARVVMHLGIMITLIFLAVLVKDYNLWTKVIILTSLLLFFFIFFFVKIKLLLNDYFET